MKKIITLNLFKEHRLEQTYKEINTIYKDEEYIFTIDGVKTIIGPSRFIRENNEYKFELNIENKKCIYLLKEQNINFDIDVEKIMYKNKKNNIILEYKISSDEEIFKIEIIIEE